MFFCTNNVSLPYCHISLLRSSKDKCETKTINISPLRGFALGLKITFVLSFVPAVLEILKRLTPHNF